MNGRTWAIGSVVLAMALGGCGLGGEAGNGRIAIGDMPGHCFNAAAETFGIHGEGTAMAAAEATATGHVVEGRSVTATSFACAYAPDGTYLSVDLVGGES
ncbi:MAG: hypothetical protein AB7O56_11180 [Bauldia sp.]